MADVAFPFGFDGRGRTAEAAEADHLRDLVEQVLFTAPGERVNRPDLGSGLLRLVFEPNGEALAAATRTGVESALQRWLGELIQVEAVTVRAVEGMVEVTVQYVGRRSQERHVERFRRGGGP